MAGERDEWSPRIKEVEREYRAVRLAVDRLLADAPSLRGDVSFRPLSAASDLLEGTYIIRLFAEFETGLRLYWATIKDTHPKTQNLVNGVAARCKIPTDLLRETHDVRDYRNDLIHERDVIVTTKWQPCGVP